MPTWKDLTDITPDEQLARLTRIRATLAEACSELNGLWQPGNAYTFEVLATLERAINNGPKYLINPSLDGWIAGVKAQADRQWVTDHPLLPEIAVDYGPDEYKGYVILDVADLDYLAEFDSNVYPPSLETFMPYIVEYGIATYTIRQGDKKLMEVWGGIDALFYCWAVIRAFYNEEV